MYRQEARIPANCPPGFLGRYNVLPGDTFYNIGFVRVYGSKLVRRLTLWREKGMNSPFGVAEPNRINSRQ